MDNLERIEAAKAAVKKAEAAQIQAETEKKLAEQQQAEFIKQMEVEGVTPQTIADEIDKLEQAVKDQLADVEARIPKV
jgi:hypothetical protein